MSKNNAYLSRQDYIYELDRLIALYFKSQSLGVGEELRILDFQEFVTQELRKKGKK